MKRRAKQNSKRPTNIPVRTIVFRVAGVTMPNPDGSDRQAIIEADVAAGMPVVLLSDTNNPYDSNAVGIWARERQIGYVPREFAAQINGFLGRDFGHEARVLDVSGGSEDRQTLCVNVEAAFWRERATRHRRNSHTTGTTETSEPDADPIQVPEVNPETKQPLGCLPYLLFVTLAAAAVDLILHWIAKAH